MFPLFIFGTGRCGSTYVQRVVSQNTTCWVWGEHDGFLAHIMLGLKSFEQSYALNKTTFALSASRTEEQFVQEMESGTSNVSWLNGFRKDSLRVELRGVIDRLFRRHLPEAWTEWGFKEILYGLGNDTPSLLMDLFPESTAVFSFRDPKATIESMLRAWNPGLLNGEVPFELLEKGYQEKAVRWRVIVSYFMNLKATRPDQVKFVSDDELALDSAALLSCLGLAPKPGFKHVGRSPADLAPLAISGEMQEKLDRLFALHCGDLPALYNEAAAGGRRRGDS